MCRFICKKKKRLYSTENSANIQNTPSQAAQSTYERILSETETAEPTLRTSITIGPPKLQSTAALERKDSDSDQEPSFDWFDDDKSVTVLDNKMEPQTMNEILGKICNMAKPHIDDEELDIDSPEVMQPIERLLCEQILDMLRADYGPFWSVIVGKRFALGVGLRIDYRSANFKVAFFNVIIFECNKHAAGLSEARPTAAK